MRVSLGVIGAGVAGILLGACGDYLCSDCGPCGFAGASAPRYVRIHAVMPVSSASVAVLASWDVRSGECNWASNPFARMHVVDLAQGVETIVDLPTTALGDVVRIPGTLVAMSGRTGSEPASPALVTIADTPPFACQSVPLAAAPRDIVAAAGKAFVVLDDGSVFVHGSGTSQTLTLGTYAFAVGSRGSVVDVAIDGALREIDAATLGTGATFSTPGCRLDPLYFGDRYIAGACSSGQWLLDLDLGTFSALDPSASIVAAPGDGLRGISASATSTFVYELLTGGIGTPVAQVPVSRVAFLGTTHAFVILDEDYMDEEVVSFDLRDGSHRVFYGIQAGAPSALYPLDASRVVLALSGGDDAFVAVLGTNASIIDWIPLTAPVLP